MNENTKKIRALGLSSGGLDSILSALVLRKQAIEVEWVSFETPFFFADKARKAAKQTGIPLTVRDITPIYMEMLKTPRMGYGQNMNPCPDCHALMFRIAGEMMVQQGFDFLFSGEVAGQRPMSQTKSSLRYVEKHAGFDGYILRPLSAKVLPETLPEKQGLVDREQLLGISGRGRKDQMALAEAFGITEYPNPGGGCLLTDKGFSRRLKDLFDRLPDYRHADLHLLRYGRHFRLDPQTKLIVGRTQKDNADILRYYQKSQDVFLKAEDFPGPVCLIPGGGKPDSYPLAAAICLSYTKAPRGHTGPVRATGQSGQTLFQGIAREKSAFKPYLI